ncbi:G-type lectin S-receptor-like serine/threonine-protein kinase [Camellia lanceoleosa]|uniref:G-type lectin S-receptor-like serine/threonine-protein kinase n=1 Tax=Camellia lanceoleosa TaxID=1840588 RepID=A0ACC0G891_9ERIC|nr:G-type lectin S-receptor-like serine/threonine-protein kinase [Camellia lanceoleosa]
MLSRFVMEQSGQVSQLAWLDGVGDWQILLTQPSKLSEVYAYCGAFSIFNENSSTHCTCLQGFKPLSTEATLLDDWSGGCERKIPLQLESNVASRIVLAQLMRIMPAGGNTTNQGFHLKLATSELSSAGGYDVEEE